MLIGSNAFSGCTALEHIKIGVRTCLIYENAFEGCEKLIVEAPYGTFPISEFRKLLKETAKTVSPEKSPPGSYVVAWTKEMMRQVDIRRKAAEKTAQKAEKPAIIVTPSGAFPVSEYFKRLEKAPKELQMEEKETDQALHESADSPASASAYKIEQGTIEEIMRNKVIPESSAFNWMEKYMEFVSKANRSQDSKAEETKKN